MLFLCCLQSSTRTGWNEASDHYKMLNQSQSRRSNEMYQIFTSSNSLSEGQAGHSSLSDRVAQPLSAEYNRHSRTSYYYPDGVHDGGSVNHENKYQPRTTSSMSAPYPSSPYWKQPTSTTLLLDRITSRNNPSTLQPPSAHHLNHSPDIIPSKQRESSGESNITSVSRQKSPKHSGHTSQQRCFKWGPESVDGSLQKSPSYSRLNGVLYPGRDNAYEGKTNGQDTERVSRRTNSEIPSSTHECSHQQATSNASNSSSGCASNTHSSYSSQTRRPFVAPLGIEHLVSHLQSIPSVPPIAGKSASPGISGEPSPMGGNNRLGGGVAFRRNQQMSQALHSIQHVDKFRTESNSSKSTSSSLHSRNRADSSLNRTSLQNLSVLDPTSPLSPVSTDLYGSLQRSPGYQSSLSSKRDSTQSSNGEMLKRNDDGSQDIEIFRPGPGESFGFFVYKEESDSDTGGDPLQSNPIITEAASMDQLLQLKLHQIENSAKEKRSSGMGSVFVSRLKDDRFGGVLNVGDEVMKVNGQSASEMSLDEIELTIQNSQQSACKRREVMGWVVCL
ncbi:uncharacterized protein LOC142354417 isoform X2 [Convolutriloba macropyga]|uniref:uncharacterized protein LOC142354417 isoform X2 n=1 Tax=Convolutriloba macropyga TaxID=536237 RepID=UPI003F52728C